MQPLEIGLLAAAGALFAVAGLTALGHHKQRQALLLRRGKLLLPTRPAPVEATRHTHFDALPAPVARYLQHVLPVGCRSPRALQITQAGTIRTGTQSPWLAFTATQTVNLARPGFLWDARIRLPLGLHLEVQDMYFEGAGSGRVLLLSAFPVAADSGRPELTAGALHRYLAEAVWYPAALLPRDGLTWTPISPQAARATLTDGPVSVSLEFRFNDAAEVAGIYTPARWGRFKGHYEQRPWEGHFADYAEGLGGILVPRTAEVGWYDNGSLELIWRGRLLSAVDAPQ